MADTKQGTPADINAVFAGLTIEPSSEPLPEPARGGQPSGPNPFTQPLQASIEHESPYTFYVPPAAVKRATFLINSAARKENVGVRVVVDVQKDANGKVVKGKDGQAVLITQTDGPNKGNVRIRFQGLKQRKQQTTPRPYSIVKDKGDATGNTYIVRERATKRALFSGTHEQAKAEYERLKNAFLNTPQPPAQTEQAAAQPAAQTPADTTEQSSAPVASPSGDAPAA